MTHSRTTDAGTGASAMFGKMLPELSMCASLILLYLDPGSWLTPDPLAIALALAVEGVSLMFFCTLVDIASRVQRRPPWWLALLIVGGVLLMYPDVIHVMRVAFAAGLWIFLPLAWSMLERVRELWTLPNATRDEKIRRRTLTFDRLWVGVCVGGIALVGGLVAAWWSEDGLGVLVNPFVPVSVGLAFYGIAAFNAWRVHQPAFAKRPTSLVPWLDRGDGSDLSRL